MTTLNGNNVTELNHFIEMVRRDPTRADRNPKLSAHWVGGSRSRIECDGKVMYVGGDANGPDPQGRQAAMDYRCGSWPRACPSGVGRRRQAR